MATSFNYVLTFEGPTKSISELSRACAPQADDGRLCPQILDVPPLSAHQKLDFAARPEAVMKEVRAWLDRPEPYAVHPSEVAAWYAGRARSADLAKIKGDFSPLRFAAILRPHKDADVMESGTQVEPCPWIALARDSQSHVDSALHHLAGDRSVLIVDSGWSGREPDVLYKVSTFLDARHFPDLWALDRIMSDTSWKPFFSARRPGENMAFLDVKTLLDIDGPGYPHHGLRPHRRWLERRRFPTSLVDMALGPEEKGDREKYTQDLMRVRGELRAMRAE